MRTSKTYLTSAVLAAAFGLPTERGTTERRSNSPQSVHREKLKGRMRRRNGQDRHLTSKCVGHTVATEGVFNMRHMKRVTALAVTSLVMGLFLIPTPAVSAPKNMVVNCDSPNGSLSDAVGNATGPTTIRFMGTCDEDVIVTKDDIVLDGQDVGTVSGTIVLDGAHRGVVQNATVTGPGGGIVADNAASVLIQDNMIVDNVGGDGVGVFNGSFARVLRNTITGNGRAALFEAGIQVSRAVARGQGNTIGNNAYAGVEVYNFGTYRTGSFISADDPDNNGDFETISVGGGAFAVDLGQMSFVDVRQVYITGDVFVGRQSMFQIRGDNRGADPADKPCSQIIGELDAGGVNALSRTQWTHVTGGIVGPNTGGNKPIGECDNLPL